MNKSIYLSCPISGLTDEQLDVVKARHRFYSEVLAEHGIKVLSPMRGKAYNNGQFTHKLSQSKAITARDHNDVKNCDLMLIDMCGFDQKSIGAAIEFGWCHAYRHPIVAVHYDNCSMLQHGIVQTLIDFVADDHDDAVDLILNILL